MLQNYYETRSQRQAAEAVAKPLKDAEDKLADEIYEALKESGKSSAKRGAFRAVLEVVAGRVAWKDAFGSLKLQAESAGLTVEQPTAPAGERLTVVPA